MDQIPNSEQEIIKTAKPNQRVQELRQHYLNLLESGLSPVKLAEQFAETQATLERLERLVTLDSLIPNFFKHDYFLHLLSAEAKAAERTTTPDSALVALDLDHFGDFNNTFGHPKGDLLLIECGKAIFSSMRSGDTPGRTGGDELSIIIHRLTTIEGAIAAAKRMQAAVADASGKSFPGYCQTVSIGICLIRNGISPELLRETADKALYDAKNAGRNKIVVGRVDPETNSITTRLVTSKEPMLSR